MYKLVYVHPCASLLFAFSAVKTEVGRRAASTCEMVKMKMRETEDKLDEERLTKRDISSDLTRQYKSMQNQLEIHIQHLEATVSQLRQELGDALILQ